MKKKTKNKKTKKKTTQKKVEESDFLAVIETLTKKLAYKFKFGYHEIDDMKQQITVFALEGLKNYDHKRPLENFLWTHVRNRLFNYKRDNYQRPTKPCLSCPLFDPHCSKSSNQCEKYEDKNNCKLYYNWLQRNNIKKNLMYFTEIDSEDHNNQFNITYKETSEGLEEHKEALKEIEKYLTDEYREIYLKIKNGCKVKKTEINKLKKHISNYLKTNE